MKRFLSALAIILGIASCATAQDERILSFHSDILVQSDGAMTVRETIRVKSQGARMVHGIYRDFPTIYGGFWLKRVVPFDVTEVLRDGKIEGYHTQPVSNGVRVYMGEANVFLPAGEHTYALTYRTNEQLGFFQDHDELYWNVTGNGWEFTIDEASATVYLPDGILPNALKCEAYTGSQGQKGKAYTYSLDAENRPFFRTAQRLFPQQGLTIVVSWPKGHVAPPVASDGLARLLKDNPWLFVASPGLLLVLIYYLAAWVRVGRDPHRGTIIPLFHPPRDLSPASMRYISRMRSDNRCLGAAIISLAVKGCLKITAAGKITCSLRAGPQISAELAAPEERAIRDQLASRQEIEFLSEDYAEVQALIKQFNLALVGSGGKPLCFGTHRGYFAAGVLMSLALFIASLALTPAAPLLVLLALLITLSVLFSYLLKAYTPAGRQLLDEIEGFRMYLAAAEKGRLEAAYPPEKTPELFEKYLPYALALGVENRWAEHFADVLKVMPDGRPYSPSWYTGSNWSTVGAAGFVSSLGSSLSSAISSSSVTPGSSSGGGGGGSSGGGGGGGGGGGW